MEREHKHIVTPEEVLYCRYAQFRGAEDRVFNPLSVPTSPDFAWIYWTPKLSIVSVRNWFIQIKNEVADGEWSS